MVASAAIAEFMTISMNFSFILSLKEPEIQSRRPLARAELEKKHYSGYHDSNQFSNKTTQYFSLESYQSFSQFFTKFCDFLPEACLRFSADVCNHYEGTHLDICTLDRVRLLLMESGHLHRQQLADWLKAPRRRHPFSQKWWRYPLSA